MRSFLEHLARESGRFILPKFESGSFRVERKADSSPVTEADRGAEEILRALIEKEFPKDGILGEEFGETRPGAKNRWFLDPIDGTQSFVAGVPLFGTLIARVEDGEPTWGALHLPALGQLLIGDGTRTTCNDKPVTCADTADLSEALLLTSEPLDPARVQDGLRWQALCEQVRLVRTWGDCYGYFLVATGRAEIMVDAEMPGDWDKMALFPILRGAGVAYSDWQGGDALTGSSLVASTAPLHPQVIAALNT